MGLVECIVVSRREYPVPNPPPPSLTCLLDAPSLPLSPAGKGGDGVFFSLRLRSSDGAWRLFDWRRWLAVGASDAGAWLPGGGEDACRHHSDGRAGAGVWQLREPDLVVHARGTGGGSCSKWWQQLQARPIQGCASGRPGLPAAALTSAAAGRDDGAARWTWRTCWCKNGSC